MITSLNPVRKVAVTGFYGRGNFGDDLVGVIFGKHLQAIGIPFKIFHFQPTYARQFGFQTADTIEELLEDCQALLWGGGGLLISWSNAIYNFLFRDFAREQFNLIQLALKRKMRLGAFSVGGDGNLSERITPLYKDLFVKNACYISVRNIQDLDLLRRYSAKGDCFPDVVWQTRHHFNPLRPPHLLLTVGMDLYWNILMRRRGVYTLPLIYLCTKIRPDLDFVFIDITHTSKKPFRAVGKHWRGRNIHYYQFHNLYEDLEKIASINLLISSRLHALMVALQYGVPALSFFSEPKTALFLSNSKMKDYCIGHKQVLQLWRVLTSPEKLSDLIRHYSFPPIDELSEKSSGHLQALTRFLGQ